MECLTDEIRANRAEVPLEPLAAQDGVLRAAWLVEALKATPATGLKIRVGPIRAESTIAVLASGEVLRSRRAPVGAPALADVYQTFGDPVAE